MTTRTARPGSLRPACASWVCLRDIIAITGYGQEADRHETLAAGFDHHF